MKRKCLFLHNWEGLGTTGMFTLIDQCTKCGWQRTINPILGEEYLYPPKTFTEANK